MMRVVRLFAAVLMLASAPGAQAAVETIVPPPPVFLPGEALTYDISWSNVVTAGIAVMEVREETLPNGRQGFKFLVTGNSAGIVDRVYPVHDIVESIFDPASNRSLTYSLQESFGTKKRRRDVVFDRDRSIVVSRLNNDPPETSSVPDHALDGLAALYYIRTLEDFTVGRIETINVFDSGKNWSVEIHTLGRETIKTPAGEFAAIKIKTYPKFEGVYQNKGEVFLWLSDDERRVPLLMKSTLKVGSFVFTLIRMRQGGEAR